MRNGIVFNKLVARTGLISRSRSLLLLITSGFFLSVSAVKAPVLHPPMGWNSFDCFNYSVTESEIMQNAHYMADKLKPRGWEYCIVDFIWWIP